MRRRYRRISQNSLQYAAGSRCFVLSSGQWVYKIPWSLAGFRNLGVEQKNIQIAGRDSFWQKYVVESTLQTIVSRSPRYQPQAEFQERAIRKFVMHHQKSFAQAPKDSADRCVPCPSLESLITQYMGLAAKRRFTVFRTSLRVPMASSHGDLHRGNIVFNGEALRLIDWAGFQNRFWRDYDLFHLLFCDIVEREGGSWVDLAIRLRANPVPLGIGEWREEDLIHYVICRCELELQQDIRLRRARPSRREKYAYVLRKFFD